MKLVKKIHFILIALALSLGLTSCKDNTSEIDFNPNVLTSREYIRAEDAVFEIVNAFLKAIHDTLVHCTGYSYIDYCDVLHIPSENSLRFGYGNVNRMCEDNKFRRGIFYAVFDGEIFAEGVKAEISTDSLFVDDLLIEAEMEIWNLGYNEENKIEYSLKVLSTNIMLDDTTIQQGFYLTADYIMTWEEGSSTPSIHEDDIFLVRGKAEGRSGRNYEFSVFIEEPLVNHIECFWLTKGRSRINVPAGIVSTGEIDYINDDGCNNLFHFYFDDNFFFDTIK